ncbi:MAG: hypothetical protein ACYCX7_00620, partial [Solirubrobacteraceae bacterium]
MIGELAGALPGWPLVLEGRIEVCVRLASQLVEAIELLGVRRGRGAEYALPAGGRLMLAETPPGTAG